MMNPAWPKRQERHWKMAEKRASPKLESDNVFGQRRNQPKMFRAGLRLLLLNAYFR